LFFLFWDQISVCVFETVNWQEQVISSAPNFTLSNVTGHNKFYN